MITCKRLAVCFCIFTLLIPWYGWSNRREIQLPTFQEGLIVDEEEQRITFPGTVRQDSGHVQFLIYLQGYSWLEEESAITSEVTLKKLQHSLASLDWELFDALWFGHGDGEELNIHISWDDQVVPAQQFITLGEYIEARWIIFWGSPYFDHIALQASTPADCAACPIFPLEQEALRDTFVRDSGDSGYTLNEKAMPPEGTKVIIQLEIRT